MNDSETWTSRKIEMKRIEVLKMWVWRRMEKINRTDKYSDEDALIRVDNFTN